MLFRLFYIVMIVPLIYIRSLAKRPQIDGGKWKMDSSICFHFSLFVTTFFGCKPKIQPFLVVKDKNN